MIGTLHAVILDCPDPLALAEFYRGIVGGEIEIEEDIWVDLTIPGTNVQLSFQRCPGYVSPTWPGDDGDQQSHLDIAVADLAEAHEQLLALGARFVQSFPTWNVYLDPVGHPFCTISSPAS